MINNGMLIKQNPIHPTTTKSTDVDCDWAWPLLHDNNYFGGQSKFAVCGAATTACAEIPILLLMRNVFSLSFSFAFEWESEALDDYLSCRHQKRGKVAEKLRTLSLSREGPKADQDNSTCCNAARRF